MRTLNEEKNVRIVFVQYFFVVVRGTLQLCVTIRFFYDSIYLEYSFHGTCVICYTNDRTATAYTDHCTSSTTPQRIYAEEQAVILNIEKQRQEVENMKNVAAKEETREKILGFKSAK